MRRAGCSCWCEISDSAGGNAGGGIASRLLVLSAGSDNGGRVATGGFAACGGTARRRSAGAESFSSAKQRKARHVQCPDAMNTSLSGKRIAFLATDGFEQVELTEPWEKIKAAGATVELVSLKEGKIQGMNHAEKGDTFPVDKTLDSVAVEDYDGLVLPGGVQNPDSLRMEPKAVEFVRGFVTQGLPVAAICHGPWTLVEADAVRGRTVTSWPSLKTDITNAGGNWVDEEVHCDQGIVTSRKPDDLPAFCAKAIEEFAEGKHARREAA